MMGFSAWYHLNACQSEKMKYFWRKFDLVGIVLQIMGSQVPASYYIFYCEATRHYFWRYTSFSWTLCIIAGVLVMLPEGLKGKKSHYLCALAFLIAGWSTSPAIVHMQYYRDPSVMHEPQFSLWAIGGIMYSVGAIVYAIKFPECCAKGCFDIVGSSHQLFHISIFIAAVLHFYASINEFHMRQINQCPVYTF
jgi:adiponectin receptor